MRIGYARVSTDDQNLDLQQDALRQARVDKSYEDKASGKSLDRPQLAECLRSLRQGDTLIVWRLDRLGRSVKDLVALINKLRERGVEFVSFTEAIDTTTPMGSFIFHITAALAELERSIIRERTRAGLASARARGRKGGRPKKLNDREWRAIRTLVDARELTIAEIASQYSVSPATIYRRLIAYRTIK
jgi:DNA invertase Pin-like site-specific DNA recombinase